jgi:hypothetical protein
MVFLYHTKENLITMKDGHFLPATFILVIGISLITISVSAQTQDSTRAIQDNSIPPSSQMQTGDQQTMHNGQAPTKGNYKMPNAQKDTSGNSKRNSGNSNMGTNTTPKQPNKNNQPVPINSKPSQPINRDSIPPHK